MDLDLLSELRNVIRFYSQNIFTGEERYENQKRP